MAQLNFDATNVKPQEEFVPIPAGKYPVTITKSELKPTKSGNGHYLELEMTVIDGQYKNRKLWARLVLRNPNPQTVKIAQSQLSSICHAVGVINCSDSTQLHNIPLRVKVVLRDGDNGARNDVNGFYPFAESGNTTQNATQNTTQQQNPAQNQGYPPVQPAPQQQQPAYQPPAPQQQQPAYQPPAPQQQQPQQQQPVQPVQQGAPAYAPWKR